jgi:leucyl aminopeptidase
MFKRNISALLFTAVASFTLSSYAESPQHIVVAPNCLIQKIDVPYKTLASKNKFSLVEVNDQGIDALIEKKHHQKELCGGFMDVTAAWDEYRMQRGLKVKAEAFLKDYITPPKPIKKKAVAYSIKYPAQVNQVFAHLNSTRLWSKLTSLTAFPDRYSRSTNGVNASRWIKDQVLAMAAGRSDVRVYEVSTGSYIQKSVVAKFGTSNEPGIVIGGHIDTTSGMKPGADDDGTGAVTVLETANAILSSGLKFKKPIYFIWYAAEEVGLVGSQYVVRDFKAKNIPVSEVIQIDMTGWPDRTNPTAMWLMDDYTNKALTAYLEALINAYVKKPIKHDRCGYGCSDHATWYKNGYASSIAFEASMNTYNPYIHSSQDTMEKLTLSHMNDYLKLAAAFAVELAEPIA